MNTYDYVGTLSLEELFNMKLRGVVLYYQGCNDTVNKHGFGIIHNLEQVGYCKSINNIWVYKGEINEIFRK